MRLRLTLSALLFTCGLFCFGKAQTPLLTLGVGAPRVSGGGSYSGPGDAVSGALVWWGLRAYSLAKAGTKIANVCNSGDANCADINSLATGGFDVTTAQGSPLNCGGSGGTCTIKTLYDQIGNFCSGSVACDVTNSTAGSRPTLVFNCIGSTLPCMAFSSQVLKTTVNASTQAQVFTVSAVGERTPSTSTQETFFSNGVNLQVLFANSANNVTMYAGSNTPLASATDTSFHAMQFILNGASSSFYIDGSSTNASSTPGGTGIAAASLCIGEATGGCGTSNTFTGGNLLELGVWASDFSASSNANASAMNSNQHGSNGYNF